MAKAKQRTLEQIEAEIERLKAEAKAMRAEEVQGVIDRIKVAIAHYGLTAKDLGLASGDDTAPKAHKAPSTPKAPKAPKAPRVLKATKDSKPKVAVDPTSRQAQTPQSPKKPSVIKFRDDAGNQWTGNGQRPRWYLAALASGKTPDDLRVPTPETPAMN